MSAHIQNKNDIAFTPEREKVLEIIQAGMDAIDTELVLRRQVKLDGDTLTIKDKTFDLTTYKHVYVIGSGKASSKAAEVIESILGDRIESGVVISLRAVPCSRIETLVGTHPLPSQQIVEAGEKILALAEKVEENDLVICLISGGGSALLCGGQEECDQNAKLYNAYLKTDGEILDLNILRKHLSVVKGGGLAKLLFPATVVGLIFSDIAGEHFDSIASGPTYKDTTTADDARAVAKKYGLEGFDFVETPKDDNYFKKVTNIAIVSNVEALAQMEKRAIELGLKAKIISSSIYTEAPEMFKELQEACGEHEVVLAGGEMRLVVTRANGTGGRCHYLGMYALPHLRPDETLCAFASDGGDNSDSAGIIIDADSVHRAEEKHLDVADYLARYDGLGLFHALGREQIFTGITEANVSDLYVLLRK